MTACFDLNFSLKTSISCQTHFSAVENLLHKGALCILGASNLPSAYREIQLAAIHESPHYLMDAHVAEHSITITDGKLYFNYFQRHLHVCMVATSQEYPDELGIMVIINLLLVHEPKNHLCSRKFRCLYLFSFTIVQTFLFKSRSRPQRIQHSIPICPSQTFQVTSYIFSGFIT